MSQQVLSPSAMESYLACPQKYWYSYKTDVERKPSFTAQVGLCFHQAMEFYVKTHYRFTFDYAMAYTLREKYFPDNISNEALEIGNRWLAKNQKYLPKPMQLGENWFPQAEMVFGPPGDVVHETKVPEGNQVSFQSGLAVHGFIDMIYPEYDPLKEQWIFVVVDWKTNRQPFKEPEFKKQSQIYALAAHKMTKGYPVRVDYWFVRFPELGPLQWEPNPDDFPKIEENLVALQNEILGNTEPRAIPSKNCQWCDYNYTCSPFKDWTKTKCCDTCEMQAKENGEKIPKRCRHLKQIWEKQPLDELVEEFEEMRERALAADYYRKGMGRVLVERMDQEGLDKLGNFQLAIWSEKVFDDEANAQIRSWEGKANMPIQLINQLEIYHKTTKAGTAYLRHSG